MLNLSERELERLLREKRQYSRTQKAVKFLDTMVRAVFVSTFIFTIAMGTIAWLKEWEGLATTLVERWFTIMVGELIVMGFIQIVKEIMQSKIRRGDDEYRSHS